MLLHPARGRRGFSLSDPWVAIVIVVVLAVGAFVMLRRMGVESKLRIIVQRNLAVLADSQQAHRRRFGRWAERLGPVNDSAAVRMIPDSGAVIVITRADSLGWTATGTHPRLNGRRSRCYIYGGGGPHEERLTKPNEPNCF